MKFTGKKNHMVDFIFPVVLLFVFAVSALVVTLFAADSYQETVNNSYKGDTARTSLLYVTEKIHAFDASGDVKIDDFDGCKSLVLSSEKNDEKYVTYIYVHDGKLMELFTKEGTEVSADNGTKILEVNSFNMNENPDGTFAFECIDTTGQKASASAGTRSSR